MHAESLEIRSRILGGDNHLDVATSYNNVANIYQAQGKYEEELEMHAESLDIGSRILGGDNHLDKAGSHVNTVNVLDDMGSLKSRLFTCKRVLRCIRVQVTLTTRLFSTKRT